GKITDDYRIEQSLPTVHYLLDHDVKLIICSHLGRPKGVDGSLSLAPVAKRLAKLLDREVEFAGDAGGPLSQQAASSLGAGGVLLLENLRFFPGEKADDDNFAKQLAGLADIFVQDGFAVAHRKDASTDAVTHYLPSVAGLLLEKEVTAITQAMEDPERPLMAIVGGAKIADKIDVLNRFIDLADMVAIGGAMANTFLAAQGVDVGASLYDQDGLQTAKDIMAKAAAKAAAGKFTFLLPSDGVVATDMTESATTRVVSWDTDGGIESDDKILDIGPASAAAIAAAIKQAKTVLWNGTMGVTEFGPFTHGTETITEAMISGEHKPRTVVGGGDTVGYVESRGLTDRFSHVSTGGGASLELMAGHKLPAVEALLDK
ncbi:MAG TPA: phosphoglycerate kinase, partial [Candidatus Saccharimonadales bacterium]|nr:phosphoglycerate kinase [Candidatus Saccharimonadales bacterium]